MCKAIYFEHMDEERLICLLVKKKSGRITLEEQLELSELLKEDYSGNFLTKGLDEIFESSLSYGRDIGNNTVNDALTRLHKKIEQAEQGPVHIAKYRRIKFWSAAASLLLVVGTAAFFLVNTVHNKPLVSNNIITTKKGSKTNLVLPDGTKVWVNADTKLVYDKEFGNTVREVILTGEAYFDVTKDKTRPFIVHTAAMDVKVLGTAFNVRAYDNEANTETTLIRGSVEVSLKNEKSNRIILSPNEKIVVQNSLPSESGKSSALPLPKPQMLKISTSKPDTLSVETQWTRNRLVFEQEKIENIIPVLERWYNVTIIQHKVLDPNRLYNGTFENDTLEDVLEALKAVGGFSYTIEKNTITIH